MRRLVLVALVASGATYGAPVASACHMTQPTNPRCWTQESMATHASGDTSGGGADERSEAAGGCSVSATQQEAVTGQNFEGFAAGYTVHDDGSPVTVTCYVTVNGVPAPGAGVSGSGTALAVATGPVTFEATDEDAVAICRQINEGAPVCGDVVFLQVPPQEVLDVADPVADLVVELEQAVADPLLCPVLATLPIDAGVGAVNSQGDVFVNGAVVHDCPPYDLS